MKEITRITVNGVVHLLEAENTTGYTTYTYQVYNAKNKTEPLEISFDLYNKLLTLLTSKKSRFKIENYYIDNDIKWENIENINITTIAEALFVIQDALSHGFNFLVRNHKIYYNESEVII